MSIAKANDTVKVHYTGKLTSGQVFDSSLERDPLQFTVGGGQMIKGFDEAVNGMAISEKKTVTIPSAEAYGDRNDELIQKVPRTELPADMKPEAGQTLVATNDNGQQTHVIVQEVTEEAITIDANHPLAGQDLIFEIELVEIV
ncbi:peptidylprolyl isomerase [Marinoscillum sp. 108]|uniref:FKBP-type peptidyl-prolyl cis-trans isomerase n=1 Tax=Marinoscillum sp. 108 TaxID=2653151 RepID=UPI0012EFE6D5|nr:peptidylprolyl isomerase [Marinoscillum sp. 108]VXD16179.1 FKBP-type peptidyl-prolyl cis-trans isomerase [Marinoscillum sp. 108]